MYYAVKRKFDKGGISRRILFGKIKFRKVVLREDGGECNFGKDSSGKTRQGLRESEKRSYRQNEIRDGYFRAKMFPRRRKFPDVIVRARAINTRTRILSRSRFVGSFNTIFSIYTLPLNLFAQLLLPPEKKKINFNSE